MSVFFLNPTNDSNPDLICPYCKQGLKVETVEEPCDGMEIKSCPECNKEIEVSTRIRITYYAYVRGTMSRMGLEPGV